MSGASRTVPERLLVPALAVAALALTAASVGIGYAPLDLTAAITDAWAGRNTPEALVLLELRLPRAILGLLVGMSLGLAGAAMQGLLRNPLAEPGIVGISGAAALGAVLVFYFGTNLTQLTLPLGGIAGAALATIVLFALAGRGAGTTTLILAGVAINAFAGSATALALNLAPNPYAALEVVFWLMGSLADRSLAHVWLAAPLMAIGWLALLAAAPGLDALTLGEDTATSLGFRLSSLRLWVITGSALAVGTAVAVTGAIGFVGLVVPHLLRRLVGSRPGALLLPSAFGGGVMVLAADIAVRTSGIRPELKLGVVTSIVGAPFLFHLIWRLRRRMT
ncbi:FecCD family ABC transporter permease [Enterovirga rhinocerotis]|uniref:Iron complex transport system permease protein n=1 Tax=Enterovirga rhinocerotis TaxID=1339210 RepID=A0A4R7BX84_9HYPH|nr:iron ABC transporter permease [Enterovirga rhinocerotis]TDR89295.1 iron complex transport system permease protein [Enterovirga rhinocerotis]